MFTSMNLAILQGTLEMAEKHVLDGERNIARQKELITEMVSLGLDVSSYQTTLANFEDTQRLHVEHVRKLKQDLVKALQSQKREASD